MTSLQQTVYMFVALRVVYEQPRAITIVKAVGLTMVEHALFMSAIGIAVVIVSLLLG